MEKVVSQFSIMAPFLPCLIQLPASRWVDVLDLEIAGVELGLLKRTLSVARWSGIGQPFSTVVHTSKLEL